MKLFKSKVEKNVLKKIAEFEKLYEIYAFNAKGIQLTVPDRINWIIKRDNTKGAILLLKELLK